MNRALRYGVALVVGLSVTGLVVRFGDGDHLVTAFVFFIYAATTSLVVAHRGTWRKLSRAEPDRRGRVLGAMGGGIGAGTMTAVGHISLPAGAAAFGLLVFGMALAIADVNRVSESSPV